MKRLAGILTALVLLFALSTASAQGGDGLFRFVHVVPGVGEVDIYIEDTLAVSGLAYGEGSNYIATPEGTSTVTVRIAGLSTELWQQPLNASTGQAVTFVASSLDPLEFVAHEDDFSPLAVGVTRFSIIHAIEGAPPVTIESNGQPVVQNLAYKNASGGFDIQADVYPLTISAEGEALVENVPFAFAAGTSYMTVLYGTPNDPQALILSNPTTIDGDAGFVRIAHTVSDAPAVDIYANETLIVPSLAFGQATEHLQLPAGTYDVDVRAAGTTESILMANLTVEAGDALTVAAIGSLEELDVNVFTDDVSGVAPDTSVISVINAIPESEASLTLGDGIQIADAIAYNSASDAASVDPVTDIGTLTLTIDGQSQDITLTETDFYGGVYTNAFVVLDVSGAFPQPTVVFAETVLAQGVISAPGGDSVVVIEAPVEEPVAEEPEVEEPVVEEPTEVAVEPTTAPVEPTAAPVQPTAPPPAPTEAPPVVQPLPAGPTARININPGANLNLRQRPSADALVLGQAPSGTTLAINGREGAPVDIDGVADPDYVDPVTLLPDEDTDLAAEETWLNVTYNTPDGGQIEAWVNALYVVVRDDRGDLLKLRELETVPGNQVGEALNTAITPPPPAEDRVTIRVVNLNPGVNLNIRRTPETTGEIINGIPQGTVALLQGVNDTADWAFITYEPPQGGIIEGWVSTQFAEYQLNGEVVDLAELELQEVLEFIPEDRRGSISAGAPTQAPPTVDPTRDAYIATVQINPGANLNVRRDPNDQSEVVTQIPALLQVIVTGRTADELWLRTSYEGVEGWIASNFVTVTFNRQAVELSEIPVVGTE